MMNCPRRFLRYRLVPTLIAPAARPAGVSHTPSLHIGLTCNEVSGHYRAPESCTVAERPRPAFRGGYGGFPPLLHPFRDLHVLGLGHATSLQRGAGSAHILRIPLSGCPTRPTDSVERSRLLPAASAGSLLLRTHPWSDRSNPHSLRASATGGWPAGKYERG